MEDRVYKLDHGGRVCPGVQVPHNNEWARKAGSLQEGLVESFEVDDWVPRVGAVDVDYREISAVEAQLDDLHARG